MARCLIDVGTRWRVPGGRSRCLGQGDPVPAVVVETGALLRYLGFSQSHQRTKKTRQTTSRSHTVHEYGLSLACLLIPRRIAEQYQHPTPWRLATWLPEMI